MTPTIFRDSCGSHLGLRLHQEHDETPCGTCATAEASRRLYTETIPTRPTALPEPHLEPLSDEQVAAHRSELLAAIEPRHLRAVGGAA